MKVAPEQQYEWGPGRCPCCYKKVDIAMNPLCARTARGWDNWISRERAAELAKQGTCPWCGRQTTIVTRTLLRRFEPTLHARERVL